MSVKNKHFIVAFLEYENAILKIIQTIQVYFTIILNLSFPFMILIAIAIAFFTFLIGYFEFAVSINPKIGFQKASRGIIVIIGLLLVFGDLSDIESLTKIPLSKIDRIVLENSNRQLDVIEGYYNIRICIINGFFLMLFLIGACSFILIIWGLGLLTLSSNDPIQKQKIMKTIFRATIGVIGAFFPLGVILPNINLPFLILRNF